MTTCLYCGRPLGFREQVGQMVFGHLWRIPSDLVPFVCSGWCGRRYKRLRRPMKLQPYEVAR